MINEEKLAATSSRMSCFLEESLRVSSACFTNSRGVSIAGLVAMGRQLFAN